MTRTERADAQRNRKRLVEVAREAFTSGQGKMSLDAIARAAGVGIGTLYRHFPTREALVEAVYWTERTQLADSAAELLARQRPDRALRAWMDRFAGYMATKREMAEALRALIADGTITSAQARAELAGAARLLLDAGAAEGTLRADVVPEDLVTALVGVLLTATDAEQATRLLDLLMDALRPS